MKAKMMGSGWHKESLRHREAKLHGRAGRIMTLYGETYKLKLAKKTDRPIIIYDPLNRASWIDKGEQIKRSDKRFLDLTPAKYKDRPKTRKKLQKITLEAGAKTGIPIYSRETNKTFYVSN